jgi:hypothetical protein
LLVVSLLGAPLFAVGSRVVHSDTGTDRDTTNP